MNPNQREQILSNAKYLRNVRPLDPEELYEYVEGAPHPAVVRQVIREAALELELVEREDGTFIPVSEEPVTSQFRGVERFPESYAHRLEELLVEQFGIDWASGGSGDNFRRVIRNLKEDYYRRNPVEYDYEAALGYALYHLPAYYAGVQYVLHEIAEKRLLPKRLRILDVGAGVGGPALGVLDYLPEDALVEYHAVEPSAAADVFESMVEDTGKNVHVTVHRTTAEAFEPDGEYDLLLFSNVLNELDDPVDVVGKYVDFLAPDGSLAAIAPADLNTSTGLREIERAFDESHTVYSPTLRLWPDENPSDRGWSFDVKPDLAVPPFQERLDDGTGEFVNVDVQYSYFVLRRDDVRRREFTASAGAFAKMADMDEHVTERVDIAAVKLSHSLSEDDGNSVFKVGDGSEQVGHFAVLAKETALNRALVEADYGEILHFENVLVLWNDDQEAYNLVVDEETVVDPIPA